jgi:hypothetical protein
MFLQHLCRVAELCFLTISALIRIVVPLSNSRDDTISSSCCSAIKTMLSRPKIDSTSLSIVSSLVQVVEKHNFSVRPEVLECFMVIEIRQERITPPPKKVLINNCFALEVRFVHVSFFNNEICGSQHRTWVTVSNSRKNWTSTQSSPRLFKSFVF